MTRREPTLDDEAGRGSQIAMIHLRGGRTSSTLALYGQLIAMQRRVPRPRARPQSVLADPEAGLRIRLLRAGAAWLIGWATIMALVTWLH